MKLMTDVKWWILAFLVAAFPVAALALQDVPPDAPPATPVNWLHYAALAIGGVLVPLATELLKPLWTKAPDWLKTLVPVFVGSLIGAAETWLALALGEPVSLALLLTVFGSAGGAASLAYKRGEANAA